MAKTPRGRAKADIATIGGLIIAVSAILGGLVLEGGQVKDIVQITAALIVVGGTVGAVMVSTPLRSCIGALKRFRHVLFDHGQSPDLLIEEIIGYATKARKNGLVSLEGDADKIQDPSSAKL